MTNAIITYIDDNMIKNLEYDFLDSLRNKAKFRGNVYIIYYGKNKRLIENIRRKYSLKVIFAKNKFMVSNQRNIDIVELLKKIDSDKVMCIDSGDVWFQENFDEIFKFSNNGLFYVEEPVMADNGFNLDCIRKVKKKKYQENLYNAVKKKRLINSGMIIGDKKIVIRILEKVVRIMKIIDQDYFALDQVIFNYVVRKDVLGKKIDPIYNFSIITNKGNYKIIDVVFFDSKGKKIKIVHNSGGINRLYKKEGSQILSNNQHH